MPGIYVMAGLTVIVTGLLCITTLNQWTRTSHRSAWLILAGLPLSLIVNRFIKTPIITSIAAWTGVPLQLRPDVPLWFIGLIWLNAPIFEEAIKIFPAVLLPRGRFLGEASQALSSGLALGMGFGLGEAAYLAYGIAQNSAYNQLPWYMFTGFASERLIVTFAHGLMTSMAVMGSYYGKRNALLGYMTAVGLHAMINLGPILLALKLIPSTFASIESYLAILLAFMIFQNSRRKVAAISGVAQKEVIYFER
ncbi:MAG TPA: hypothetical protein VK206_03025 [Anaerolineales bacterium]|nr:hypothetical protein [Anaerolineales bacterium]